MTEEPADTRFRRPTPVEPGFRGSAPAELGFRWPAEWEPHAATWLCWPHNEETWPGRLSAVEAAFAAMVEALCPHETVCIGVADEPVEEHVRAVLRSRGVDADRGVRCYRLPSDDAWLRDSGPVFVVAGEGEAREHAVVDFGFDAWGGKYPPWDRDAELAERVATALGLRRFACSTVLEAGSVDGDGRGTLLTTESCLLNVNRGSGRTREHLEALLGAYLGARRVLWLSAGVAGDDTDGHVDNLARFVDTATVVAAVESDPADPNFAPLQENLRRLRAWRDSADQPLEVVPLPLPPPLHARGVRLPASYANFYLANAVALVPHFGVSSDARAQAVLRDCLPGREIVPIPCADLVVGLGAIHCLTQQQPA